MKRFTERYKKNVYDIDILDLLKRHNCLGNYRISDLKKSKNTLNGYILYRDEYIYDDYMDESMRKYTQYLSENLRDVVGKNIFYNIVNGKITIQI